MPRHTFEKGNKLSAGKGPHKSEAVKIGHVTRKKALAEIRAAVVETAVADLVEVTRGATLQSLSFLLDVMTDESLPHHNRLTAARIIFQAGHADARKGLDVEIKRELPGGIAQMIPGQNYGEEYLLERMRVITAAIHSSQAAKPEKKP